MVHGGRYEQDVYPRFGCRRAASFGRVRRALCRRLQPPRQRAWCVVRGVPGRTFAGRRAQEHRAASRRVTLPAILAGTQDPDHGLQQFVSQELVGRGGSGLAATARSWLGRLPIWPGFSCLMTRLFQRRAALPWAYSASTAGRWAKGQLPGSGQLALRRQGGPRAAGPTSFLTRELVEDAGRLDKAGVPENERRVRIQRRNRPGVARRRPRRERAARPSGGGRQRLRGQRPLRAGLAARGLGYVLGVKPARCWSLPKSRVGRHRDQAAVPDLVSTTVWRQTAPGH